MAEPVGTGQAETDAAGRLDAAFRQRAGQDIRARGGRPPVGLFGDGCPEAFVLACGGGPLDVKAPPEGAEEIRPPDRVARILEDFVDPYAARFLARYATGWYDGFAAILFVRDDPAGLVAYQYALELRRQGRVASSGPDLLLWNLVRSGADSAHLFNLAMAKDVAARLGAVTGGAFSDEAFGVASAEEGRRMDALRRAARHGVAGAAMHRWRNAGRWLPAPVHADLLDAAKAGPGAGPAIGLIGCALADDGLHAALDRIGRVTVDLQPYGEIWPGPHADGAASLDACLAAVARDPVHLRAMPPQGYRAALVERLSGCDVVLAQSDRSDDAFGWEVPSLAAALRDRGVPLVDAGPRDWPPSRGWIRQAVDDVAAVAGVAA